MSEFLAKSKERGGTLLIEHLRHVAYAARQIAEALNMSKEEINLAYLGGIFHDIGKAHPDFQKRLYGDNGRNFDIPLRHELSSLLFLPLVPRESWPVLVDMIVAHHKSIGAADHEHVGTKGIVHLCGQNGCEDVFDCHAGDWHIWAPKAIELLAELGIEPKQITLEEARQAFDFTLDHCEAKTLGWSKWKGLLIAADHFASALIDGTYEHGENLFKKPDLGLFSSRSSELYPLSMISTDDKRPHTLVTAPTGAGKTDFLMRRCRGRVFYTLPFQASINAMFSRFENMLPDIKVRVLHAASRIVLKDRSQEEKALQGLVGSSVKVLTPHQLAALITGTRGFESLAIDIAGADVILDEIHCYSDKAQSMVLEIVRVLLRLDCRIHVGTATMPTVLYESILELLGGEEKVYRVSLTNEQLQTFNRHIVLKHDNESDAFSVIEDALKNGEKILIVSNRVDAAQKRFKELSERFPKVNKMLIHSRFKRGDRAEKEKQLYTEFENKKEACIVVATQVVEVSLDISFDRMITDCAPLDALVQRFGRINRKRTADTIGKMKPIHIIAPPASKTDALPYKKEILDRSFDQLPDGEILKETEIQSKIDAVYPIIEPVPIDTHLVWKDEQFCLTELCHYSGSVLMDMLEIESATMILNTDQEKYQNAHFDERPQMEIPVPQSVKYRKIQKFGQLEVGAHPIVVSDELYSKETGLRFEQIDNFL